MVILYLLCIGQLTVFTCLCHLKLCAYVIGVCRGRWGYVRNIYTACYTDWVFTLLTTCQLSVPSFSWVVNIAICLC
mgnify:CR=1 FL=1